jgi:DNA-binding NtrC family response regulator
MTANRREGSPKAESVELSTSEIADSHVVVVDDDEVVTRALKGFLMLELDIEPYTFNRPMEALEHVRQSVIDLVICDIVMPEMDGIDLLREVRRLQPEVPRILLTGNADKENAIRAINEVQVFQYVEKPWDNEQLRMVVVNALERRMLMRMLSRKMEELTQLREDLADLRKALVRAFA